MRSEGCLQAIREFPLPVPFPTLTSSIECNNFKTNCLLSAYNLSGILHALLGLKFLTQYHLESSIPSDI